MMVRPLALTLLAVSLFCGGMAQVTGTASTEGATFILFLGSGTAMVMAISSWIDHR